MGKRSDEEQPRDPFVDRCVAYFFPGWGLKRAQARFGLASYDAAQKKRGSKDRSGKQNGGSGDDHIDHYDLWTLRETARDLDRNNGLAMAIVDRIMENVISSTGFELRPKTEHEDSNKKIKEDFSYWFTHELDACREFSGWSYMRNVFRSYKRDGDYFLQFRPQGNCSVMGFEADRVLNPDGQHNGVSIGGLDLINGIAKKDGVKKYLWVADKAPTSSFVPVSQGKAIRADQVIQIYSPRRTTQGRGVPICAPLIREIDDIDDLLAWERQAAKLAASQNMVVKTENPVGASEWMRSIYQDRGNGVALEELDPLQLNYLRVGEEIQSIQSNRPNNTFESFILLLNRYVGIPLGLPLELVLLDFSNVNFASSRQLLNQAQRRFEIEQDDFAWFMFKIYQLWLTVRLERGFYDRDKLGPNPFNHVWGFPGWPSPNPLQDAQACALAIQYAFGSRTEWNRKRGVSQDQIEQELEKETGQLVERAIPISDKINPLPRSKDNNKPKTQEAA
tara:strand:- start:23702 stop:25216 length:1515 start_codon:yes stop_codon:yes gene_type:complete